VHPNGRFVYLTNRAAATVELEGKKVFAGGENSVAVFSIDPATGEPTLIQNIDGRGIQLRTFAMQPAPPARQCPVVTCSCSPARFCR
jgi:6-phosphogluconolactonase